MPCRGQETWFGLDSGPTVLNYTSVPIVVQSSKLDFEVSHQQRRARPAAPTVPGTLLSVPWHQSSNACKAWQAGC